MRRALAVAALVLLAACGEGYNGPEIGTITNKEYDDEDSWYQAGYTIDGGETCTGGYGNPPSPRVCTDNPDTHIPGQWHTEPARYLITIEDGDKKGTLNVPPSVFDAVRVGDKFNAKTLERIPQ